MRALLVSVAIAAIPATAFAQGRAPENLLPPEPPTVTPAKVPTGTDEVTTSTQLPAARADMAATVQPVTPMVQSWNMADAQALAAVRAELARRRSDSGLFDMDGFARDFAAAVHGMAKR